MLTVAAALQAPVTKVAPIARSGVRRYEMSSGDAVESARALDKRSRVKWLRKSRELPPRALRDPLGAQPRRAAGCPKGGPLIVEGRARASASI